MLHHIQKKFEESARETFLAWEPTAPHGCVSGISQPLIKEFLCTILLICVFTGVWKTVVRRIKHPVAP